MAVEDLKAFSREPDGSDRTKGHAIVAWWLGNWASANAIHTNEQLRSLGNMIDEVLAQQSEVK